MVILDEPARNLYSRFFRTVSLVKKNKKKHLYSPMFISEQDNRVSSAQCQNLHNIGVTMGKKKTICAKGV